MKLRFSASLLALGSAALLAHPHEARACGGCFVQPQDATIVTGHRMVLSLSPDQSVLWDQIKYAGDPAEFAWVLPVRVGATIEVASDAWFEALDAATAVRVSAPTLQCVTRSQVVDDYSYHGCQVAAGPAAAAGCCSRPITRSSRRRRRSTRHASCPCRAKGWSCSSAAQRPACSRAGSRPAAERDATMPIHPAGEHLAARAAATPDKAAIVLASTGEVRTYADLDAASARLARVFRDRGLRTGDHLAKFPAEVVGVLHAGVQPLAASGRVCVRGVAGQLTQVFVNLFTNAAHAMREQGGLLSISTSISSNDLVEVTICDDGHGIEEGNLPRIFDPFFTTKTDGAGTGLGLSIVQRIVGNHGGTIRADGNSPRGTVFHVELPAAAAPPDDD